MVGTRPEARDTGHLPFTEAARRLLSDARAESDRLRHEYIGTEHVVLALAQDADTIALLTRLGIDPEHVRASLDSIVRPGTATLPHGAERPYTSKTMQAFAFAAECARSHGHSGVGELAAAEVQQRGGAESA
jgi:ATP-dependent Clp protease ATP-binding subunit ClpC